MPIYTFILSIDPMLGVFSMSACINISSHKMFHKYEHEIKVENTKSNRIFLRVESIFFPT